MGHYPVAVTGDGQPDCGDHAKKRGWCTSLRAEGVSQHCSLPAREVGVALAQGMSAHGVMQVGGSRHGQPWAAIVRADLPSNSALKPCPKPCPKPFEMTEG